mgnify:CR=1 FL=1
MYDALFYPYDTHRVESGFALCILFFVKPITRILAQTGNNTLSQAISLLRATIDLILNRRSIVAVILETRH